MRVCTHAYMLFFLTKICNNEYMRLSKAYIHVYFHAYSHTTNKKIACIYNMACKRKCVYTQINKYMHLAWNIHIFA